MITILTTPQLFTTLNLSLFKIASDRPTILKFKVSLLDAITGDVMAVQSYATLPMIPLGTSFNVAPLLSAFLSSHLDMSTDFIKPVDKIYKSYKISIQEIYLVGSTQANGDTLESPVFNIFNATLSRPDFIDYDYRKFVTNAAGIGSVFLSQRPLVSKLYRSSIEYLYFNSIVSGKVRITFYKKGGLEMGVHEIAFDATTEKSFRINLTPSAISAYFGDDLSNEYGGEFEEVFDFPFGSYYGLTDANYFTVCLINNDGAVISEIRTYVLTAEKCSVINLEILFLNNFGGFDSMVFTEPRQTVNSSKTYIQANPYQYDADGNYSDIKGSIFNPTEVSIGSKNVSTFSTVSEPLSDLNALFARTLIESEEVYIRLKSGKLLPIKIEDQEYSINKIKYNTNNYRLTVTFKISDTNFNL